MFRFFFSLQINIIEAQRWIGNSVLQIISCFINIHRQRGKSKTKCISITTINLLRVYIFIRCLQILNKTHLIPTDFSVLNWLLISQKKYIKIAFKQSIGTRCFYFNFTFRGTDVSFSINNPRSQFCVLFFIK